MNKKFMKKYLNQLEATKKESEKLANFQSAYEVMSNFSSKFRDAILYKSSVLQFDYDVTTAYATKAVADLVIEAMADDGFTVELTVNEGKKYSQYKVSLSEDSEEKPSRSAGPTGTVNPAAKLACCKCK